jgi:hypothetical protein
MIRKSLSVVLLMCFCRGNAGASMVEWRNIRIEDAERDGDTLVLSKLELPFSDKDDVRYLRIKFEISELLPDLFLQADNYSYFSNLKQQNYIQVSVNVWTCRKSDSTCKQHNGPKNVHLGVDPDDYLPHMYESINESQAEVTLHTSFCAHPPNLFDWHLAIAALPPNHNEPVPTADPDGNQTVADLPQLFANVRIEIKQAHGVGGSTAVVTTPTVILFGLPLESSLPHTGSEAVEAAGADPSGPGLDPSDAEETVFVRASAARSEDTRQDAEGPWFESGFRLVPLGLTADACPPPTAVRAAVAGALGFEPTTPAPGEHARVELTEKVRLRAGERGLWLLAAVFDPAAAAVAASPAMSGRLTVEVDLSLTASAPPPLAGCAGPCAVRAAEYALRAAAAANASSTGDGGRAAAGDYAAMRLLFPRRHFPALRAADAADRAGLTHGKWGRYAAACRLLALEIGDTHAAAALAAAAAAGLRDAVAAAAVSRLEAAAADAHAELGRAAAAEGRLEAAEAHLRRAALVRGGEADLDELGYILMRAARCAVAEPTIAIVGSADEDAAAAAAAAAAIIPAATVVASAVAAAALAAAHDRARARTRAHASTDAVPRTLFEGVPRMRRHGRMRTVGPGRAPGRTRGRTRISLLRLCREPLGQPPLEGGQPWTPVSSR